jgi:hypothetical protein
MSDIANSDILHNCDASNDINALRPDGSPSEANAGQDKYKCQIADAREAFARWARKQKFKTNDAKTAAACVPANLLAAPNSLFIRQRLATDIATIERDLSVKNVEEE